MDGGDILSDHYWYWIHNVELNVDLDVYSKCLMSMSVEDKDSKNRIDIVSAPVIRDGPEGRRVLEAFGRSKKYNARINIELEDTGLLHMTVDLSEISIPAQVRTDWLKKLIKLYSHAWYSIDDLYLLTSNSTDRAEAIDEIGRGLYNLITSSFDDSFVPNSFNQITADTRMYMVFADSYMEKMPELSEDISGRMKHLHKHMDPLLDNKMRRDEVYWNFRGSELVRKLTISTILLMLLSLAVSFFSGSIFNENIFYNVFELTLFGAVATTILATVILLANNPFSRKNPKTKSRAGEAMRMKHNLVKTSAEANDPLSQLELGRMYECGIGVDQDLKKAKEWYEKSANNGNAEAQFNLGVLYEGEGTSTGYHNAAKWYGKAAEQGYAQAYNYYGELYKEGWGVNRSYKTAATLYKRAADLGDVYGMFNLGSLYLRNNGVGRNCREAADWLGKAAELDDMDAQYHLALLYRDGEGVERSNEDYLRLLNRSADQGMPSAIHELGRYHQYEEKGDDAIEKAIECYRTASMLGDGPSEYALGEMYRRGNHLDKSLSKACELIKRSAEHGYGRAQFELGQMYLFGEGVGISKEKALDWYVDSLIHGEDRALDRILELCVDRELSGYYAIRLRNYKRAAKGGDPEKQYLMGEIYNYGLGVERSEETSKEWYQYAAANGNELAQDRLGELLCPWKDLGKTGKLRLSRRRSSGVAPDVYRMANSKPIDHSRYGLRRGETVHCQGTPYDSYEVSDADYFRRSAESGEDVDRQLRLCAYQVGNGAGQSAERAAERYGEIESLNDLMAAAFHGDPEACLKLGKAYHSGMVIGVSIEMAFEWYRQAAERGNREAQETMAKMYRGGYRIEDRCIDLFKGYKAAADASDPDGQYCLGFAYLYGCGTDISVPDALESFKRAADQGNWLAQVKLGDMYRDGIGVEQSEETARKWYEKASIFMDIDVDGMFLPDDSSDR